MLIRENPHLFLKWVSLQMYSNTVAVKWTQSQLLTRLKLVLSCYYVQQTLKLFVPEKTETIPKQRWIVLSQKGQENPKLPTLQIWPKAAGSVETLRQKSLWAPSRVRIVFIRTVTKIPFSKEPPRTGIEHYTLTQGSQTHFHQWPRQPCSWLQRAKHNFRTV